ncbi:MAG: putative toxin-antitoxin system toxin component, PIN family [Candidatus Latescibacteria bacterium]|nr:putative toxin-antitoxin system toxin component, PIN family [Candidatus Latescibacterota bacterium]
MRLVVDTNVFISGIFFTGPPHRILDAWRRSKVELVVDATILAEYRDTGLELAAQFDGVELAPWLDLLTVKAKMMETTCLEEPVCTDPDDDKFLACALASRSRFVVTGGKALLRTSGYKGLTVLTPRAFVNAHL